jgi:hypothetical protein
MVFGGHAPDKRTHLRIDARSSRPPPRATAPASTEPFAPPTLDCGRLDQHQPIPPPRPQPSQAQPELTVSGSKAPIETSEDAQLVAQGQKLEEAVSARGQR